jgi:hypothetical protein
MNRLQLKKYFKNITQGRKNVTQIIRNTPLNEPFRHAEIESLLEYHPHEGKITEIDYLIVKIREPYNQPALYFKNKGCIIEDDCSYVQCMTNLFGKHDVQKAKIERIIHTFRDSTSMTAKKTYYIEHLYAGCVACGTHDNLAVDHYPVSFQQILDEYISENNIQVLDLDVRENDEHIWEFLDDTVRDSWVQYHDGRATFRILCKSCNSSGGAYGYKTRDELWV